MAVARAKRQKRHGGAAFVKRGQRPILIAPLSAGWKLVALQAAALAVCVYLTYAHYRLRHQLGWHSAFGGAAYVGCDPVLLRQWSSIGPVPIAALGIAVYGVAAAQTARRIRRFGGLPASSATMLAVTGAFSAAVWAVTACIGLVTIRTICWLSFPLALLGM